MFSFNTAKDASRIFYLLESKSDSGIKANNFEVYFNIKPFSNLNLCLGSDNIPGRAKKALFKKCNPQQMLYSRNGNLGFNINSKQNRSACLDVEYHISGRYVDNANLHFWDCHGYPNQRFKFEKILGI